jgi:hypothetical protein
MTTLTLKLTQAHYDKAAGDRTDSWICVDCGFNTAPGFANAERTAKALRAYGYIKNRVCEKSEIYFVKSRVWQAANIDGWGGCLCIGCLENRLDRKLRPRDFDREHPFNSMPGTARLRSRRGAGWMPATELFAA